MRLALILALTSTASAGGRVVRVDKPLPSKVYVPSGTFPMGLTDRDIDDLGNECDVAIQTQVSFQTSNGSGTLCDVYRDDLAHMHQRDVYVDAFSIDRTEVTTGAYRTCVAAGGCTLDALIAGDERYIGPDAFPMVNVTWDESRRFCAWRGGRLPTEAEWEKAARGSAGGAWPWGTVQRAHDFNHGKPRAQVVQKLDRNVQWLGDPDRDDGFELLAPVGSFPFGEGPYGALDQAGNVAEWTQDAWMHDLEHEVGYESKERDGWHALPTVNPRRDGGMSERRVVRGGSWREPMFIARANARDPFNVMYTPDGRFSHVGFRCAY